jgi:hypothetical protein
VLVSALYLELLSDTDLALLSALSEDAVDLRAAPERIEAVLAAPRVFEAFFGQGSRDELVALSPHLAFALLIARVRAELDVARFFDEWVGPGRRVPVFDVRTLRAFLDAPERRVFLVELLASYTMVASGSVWIRAGRSWRRQRYNDLDPVRLAALLEVVPAADRAAVVRRLGDLALFLSGVFPDRAGREPLPARHLERIRRVLGAEREVGRLAGAAIAGDAIATLEWLGSAAYRVAHESLEPRAPSLLLSLAERFADARRVLNVVADRYLFPYRARLFGGGSR